MTGLLLSFRRMATLVAVGAVFGPGCRRPLPAEARYSRAAGFSLLEVLIALAVFTLAATALVQAGAQRADNLAYLRDRTLASWVATNRISELRIERVWYTGTRTGSVGMAGNTWHWRSEISETPNESIRRVEIAVALEPGAEPVTRMTGYLGDPSTIADERAGGGR